MHPLILALSVLAPLAVDDTPPEQLEPAPIAVRPAAQERPPLVEPEWQEERREPQRVEQEPRRERTWSDRATFFTGARTAVAFPPGGDGPAPLAGIELGVAAESGFGFGMHAFGAMNTPGAPALGLPKTPYGFGAEVDLRYYMQTIEPLRLYPTMSVGFIAGPGETDGKNVVLPLITPGFGARLNFGSLYTAMEIGAADFYMPFMAIAVGWEPDRV